MKVFVDNSKLGHGMVWNHCTEKYSILGQTCKEAGVKDREMDFRMSLVFLMSDEDKKADLQEPSKMLPESLNPFFMQDVTWKPISEQYKDSKKFKLTELGKRLEALNDSAVSPGVGAWEATGSWNTKVEVMCAEGGIEVEWGVKPESE